MTLTGFGINRAQVATCHKELVCGLMVAACDSTADAVCSMPRIFSGAWAWQNEYHLGNVLVLG